MLARGANAAACARRPTPLSRRPRCAKARSCSSTAGAAGRTRATCSCRRTRARFSGSPARASSAPCASPPSKTCWPAKPLLCFGAHAMSIFSTANSRAGRCSLVQTRRRLPGLHDARLSFSVVFTEKDAERSLDLVCKVRLLATPTARSRAPALMLRAVTLLRAGRGAAASLVHRAAVRAGKAEQSARRGAGAGGRARRRGSATLEVGARLHRQPRLSAADTDLAHRARVQA